MPDLNSLNAAEDPSVFDGRLMVDILEWDWKLRLAVSDVGGTQRRARFPGLDYSRDFIIHGRVRAPRELRGKRMKVTLSPFGPKVRFGPGDLEQVGTVEVMGPGSQFDFSAVLMLPEEAVAATATSLASAWKHLQIMTFDEGPAGAKVSAYFPSANIHPNLESWANAD